jgi:hypothetical protein
MGHGVDPPDAIPLGVDHLGPTADGDTRVGEEAVNPAEGLPGVGDERPDRRWIPDVDVRCDPSHGHRGSTRRIEVQVGEHHGCALFGEPPG